MGKPVYLDNEIVEYLDSVRGSLSYNRQLRKELGIEGDKNFLLTKAEFENFRNELEIRLVKLEKFRKFLRDKMSY